MSAESSDQLSAGNLPPRILTPPPGPRSRELSKQLAEYEAPGINTLYAGQPGLLWREALGANVLDVDGNRFIDLTAGFGVASVGHRHPDIVSSIHRQSDSLLHGLGDVSAHPKRVELAQRLCTLAPIDQAQVYFAVSGADAIEIALKTAYLATRKAGFVVFDPSYHGLTLGALAATSRPAFRYPAQKHLHQEARRLPFGCDPQDVRRLLRQSAQIGAVLLEPIVGREGIVLPPSGWIADLRRICSDHGALLIVDEIFTGFGRTGTLFAVEAERVEPDLICCGKALGGGLPIGAVLGRRSLLASWRTSGEALHTATFVAHPLACAAGLTVLDLLDKHQLAARADRLGKIIADRLPPWTERFSCLNEVRGRGLMWGLELGTSTQAQLLTHACQQKGLLMLAGGPQGRVAQIVPPLTLHRSQLDLSLDIIESVLSHVDKS